MYSKISIFIVFILQLFFSNLYAQSIDSPIRPKYEFQQVTAIESVIPGGLGRSRLLSTDKNGKKEELKLDNFFSLVGINFGNIKDNDQIITKKIETLYEEGWELLSTNAGAYSGDGTGIFITRYIFRRIKQ